MDERNKRYNEKAERDALAARVADLEAALNEALRLDPTCKHTYTEREGVIWTRCEECGGVWADDEGGIPDAKTHPVIALIIAVLASTPAQSLERVKAAALREAAERVRYDDMNYCADVMTSMADDLERHEADRLEHKGKK